MSYQKPLPITKGLPKIYWDGLKEEKLLIQHCNECREMIFFPRVMCPHCGGTNIDFKEHNGLGEIYSYTVVHRTRTPGFKDEVPYVVALVNLSGGKARIMTNIIDCSIDEVEIGKQVEIVFSKADEEVTLPHFRLGRGEVS
jgi:uncharacterized OB-fold protein